MDADERVWVQTARALGPVIEARAEEADALRRLPDATLADFRAQGFFRLLRPRRWGGYEADPQVFFDVQAEVAARCASSAWVLGVLGVHAWQLALFDARAQEDVWGADPEALIASSYAPTGRVLRVEGGYRLSGRWSFSSGCDHCGWVFLGGFVPVDDPARPDMRTFLLPRADWRIEDNWHVAGLKATGSKDVVVEDAFVPEHRTHRLMDGFRRSSPGNAVNPGALYRVPFGQLFVRSVSTPAVGAARGALEAWLDGARHRVAASDGARVALDPATQAVVARAAALVDESELVLRRNLGELMAAARAGEELSLERRASFRHDSALAVVKCVEAVDALFTASGGRAIFLGHPLLRRFLDVHAARAHYANNPEKPARNLGGLRLGLKNQDFFL